MNRDLMITVERVVRDIRASHARKMRMREELYTLLNDRVDHMVCGGKAELEAVQEAISSFGDPAELRSELRATVPALERYSATFERFLICQPQTPTFGQAISVGQSIRAGALLGTMMLMGLFLPAAFLGFVFGKTEVLLVWHNLLAVAGVFAWNAAVMAWCGGRAIRALLVAHRRWDAIWSLVGWAAAAGLSFGASEALLFMSAGWESFRHVGWWSALCAVPASAGVFMLVCWLISFETEQGQSWVSLELADS